MPDINAQGDLTLGGDVVGRDKTVQSITVGNITGSTGVAIGAGAQAQVTVGGAGPTPLDVVFAPILEKVQALPDGPAKVVAQQAAQGLRTEAEKGDAADEPAVSGWLGFLAQLAPEAWAAAVAAFTRPNVSVSAGIQKIAAQARAAWEAGKPG